MIGRGRYSSKITGLCWSRTSRYLATSGGNQVTIWDFAGRGPAGSTPICCTARFRLFVCSFALSVCCFVCVLVQSVGGIPPVPRCFCCLEDRQLDRTLRFALCYPPTMLAPIHARHIFLDMNGICPTSCQYSWDRLLTHGVGCAGIGLTADVSALSFQAESPSATSPDGTRPGDSVGLLAVGGSDGSVQIYDLGAVPISILDTPSISMGHPSRICGCVLLPLI
eukprot:COSAG05_NODE_361_length_10793_cov_141.983262_3_plen_223_part_00